MRDDYGKMKFTKVEEELWVGYYYSPAPNVLISLMMEVNTLIKTNEKRS